MSEKPMIEYEKFLKVVGEGGDWGTIRVSQIAALTRWTSSSGDQEIGHGVTVFLVGGQQISLDGEDYFAIKRAIGWND